jgi:uncharacterized membrane protein
MHDEVAEALRRGDHGGCGVVDSAEHAGRFPAEEFEGGGVGHAAKLSVEGPVEEEGAAEVSGNGEDELAIGDHRDAAGVEPLPEVAAPAGPLADYAGRFAAPDREIRVEAGKEDLRALILGAPHILRPIGGDRFISDGRLAYGAVHEFLRDGSGRVAGLRSGGVEHRRVEPPTAPAKEPDDLRRFTGRYGWPHNVLKVFIHDGKLACLVEWFYEYPLERAGGSTFSFPDYGLYENEELEFIELDGRVVEARLGSVPFPRLTESTSLIAPDDHWWIWTVLIGAAALSIALEQKNRIARKLTGPVIALFGGMVLSNAGIMPAESASYGIIWNYLIPLVVPLLLLRMNVLKVIRETGRLFAAFHLSALGTFVGGFLAVLLLNRLVPHLPEIGAAMTASYIGGAVNFVAMVDAFKPPEHLVNATIVADNGCMALYFLFLIALPAFPFARKLFPENDRTRSFSEAGAEGGAEAYWKPKPVSLLSLSATVAVAFAIAAVSVKIAGYFAAPGWPDLVREVLGQKYLVLTTISIAVPLLFPRMTESLGGSDELGTFLIYVFFILVGIPASFREVLVESPVLLLFCAIMLALNFLVTFVLGKLLGYEMEELILCAVVSSGGPMNGAAIAISKGWTKLVLPSVLAGIWGYVIGNYCGFAAGKLFLGLFG